MHQAETIGYTETMTITFGKTQQTFKVLFDVELEPLSEESERVKSVAVFLEKLDGKAWLLSLAHEVAAICFEQSVKKPGLREIKRFAADISILTMTVFNDDMIFYAVSLNQLPDMVITCQTDFSQHIKQVELVEERFVTFNGMQNSP